MFEDLQVFHGEVTDLIEVRGHKGILMRVKNADGTLGYYLVEPCCIELSVGDRVDVTGRLSETDQFHISEPSDIRRVKS